jgi:hypothetical protein
MARHRAASSSADMSALRPEARASKWTIFPGNDRDVVPPEDRRAARGIQRTFLGWSGKGKAQVEKGEQKMSLGPCRGGVVRLAEPIDGKPLLLGEGVETVLTVMEATGLPGWATLGAGS